MSTQLDDPVAPLALLQVSLGHEYYPDGFTEFDVAPFPATATNCRQLGLRLLREGDGLTLYVSPNAQRRLQSAGYRAALSTLTLCWQITPTTEKFSAFTDLDATACDQCVVFSSNAIDAKSHLLTVGALASAKDIWARQTLRFDFVPSRPLRVGTTVTLENSAGESLRELVVTDPAVISIDATSFGSGLYQLTQGTRVLTRWFADERGAAGTLPGSVLVLPGALLTAVFSNALGNMAADTELPVYSATYPARTVVWRYRIFNTPPGESLNIVAVSSEGTDDSLTTPPRTSKAKAPSRTAGPFLPKTDPALPDAQSFEVGAFKLMQRPPQRFALRNGTATRYSPLPLAGLSFARSSGNAPLYSEILVYL